MKRDDCYIQGMDNDGPDPDPATVPIRLLSRLSKVSESNILELTDRGTLVSVTLAG